MAEKVTNRVKRATVLKLLAERMPIKVIAEKLGKSKVSLYKMRDRLREKGLLNQDYSFTKLAHKVLEEDSLLLQNVSRKNVIRLHNAAIVVKLAGRPLNWDERRESWRVQKQGRAWRLLSGSFTEVKVTDTLRVRTTPSSVIIFFGEVYADDPSDAKDKLFHLALSAISQVEVALKVRLHKQGTFIFRTSQQEFAMVKNQLAVELCKAGFKIRVEDMRGRARVIVDESLGFGELETPNAIHGENDAAALKGLFEDVAVYGLSLRMMHQRIEGLEKALQESHSSSIEERREVS